MFADLEGNLLLAFPDEDVAHVLDRSQRALLAVICALTVVVIVGRWWRTVSRPRRRALLPSLAGALVLALFTALLVNDLISGTRSQALLVARRLLARDGAGGVPGQPAALRAWRAAGWPSCSSASARSAAPTCRPRS